jgi:MFS family permease
MGTTHDHPSGEWRALARRPQYPSFVITVAVSRIVAAMFNTAGVLLVLDRTGSAVLAGGVAAMAVLPGAIAGPVLGAWLDVIKRRRALIVADQLTSIVALAAMVVLAGHAPGWTLLAAAVLLGVTRPFSTGSFASALSALTGPELLDRASTIEASSMNLGVVIGPALAGALSAIEGPAEVVELQVALTALLAVVIAFSPAFEARGPERAESVRHALREGTRALRRQRLLRDTAASSMLTNLTWGLMLVVFPLYAAGSLHAGASASGYLWAALAGGSILGTFALPGRPSRRRIGLSYLALALSSLLWILAGSLLVGIVLVTLSGTLEGPAYSGTVALRQRHAPPGARTQVLNTIQSLNQLTTSMGSILGGLLHHPATAIAVFCGLNLLAAAIAGRGGPVTSVTAK